MFLAQVPTTPGIEVAAIADLAPDRARAACRARRLGPSDRIAATRFTDDAMAMIASPAMSRWWWKPPATRPPASPMRAAPSREGKHIVMVNVEADVLAGAAAGARGGAGRRRLLAGLRRPAGADLRTGRLGARLRLSRDRRRQGHEIPAGIPRLHARDGVGLLRPDTGTGARIGGMNPQMFNSFLDGTKSGIEMAAVANATGLTPPPDGLRFPALRHARNGARCCGPATPARCITPARWR